MGRLSALPPRLASLAAKVRALPKVADRFYQSPEWIALRERRKRDPDYAAAKARLKPGEWLVLDHVVELKDGGSPLDPANTKWRTHSEHQAKTARARASRAAGGRDGAGGGRKSGGSPPP